MIEISHKQARYLIRLAADRRLPDEQWSALQAHLENCAACHGILERQTAHEKRLRRGLQSRWRTIDGPFKDLAGDLLAARGKRKTRQRRFVTAGFGLLAVLALVLVRLTIFPRTQTRLSTPTPLHTAEATVPSERFKGILAFSLNQSGHRNIYLLNTGMGSLATNELTDLTAAAADDTDPAWSPDGEWLAFLSNRTGKSELFVISVAGTRLTQLTNTPEVIWQGPLTWSADGKWIALTGKRNGLDNQPWIYLISVDGSASPSGEPIAVPGTRGTTGLVWFSKNGSQSDLVYASPQLGGTIMRYDMLTGDTRSLTAEDNRHGLKTGINGIFDYYSAGQMEEVVYAAQGPVGADGTAGPRTAPSGMHIRLAISNRSTGERLYNYLVLGANDTFRAVSYIPADLRIAYLSDQGHSGCWTIHLRLDSPTNLDLREVTELCVEGGLSEGQWSADGRWAVLLARKPEESAVSLYALRLPATQAATSQAVIERLGDAQGIIGPLISGPVVSERLVSEPLRLRPSSASLGIHPRAASAPAPEPVKFVPPASLTGTVLFNVPVNDPEGKSSAVFKLNPDGTDLQQLLPAEAANNCPVWSPDGNQIAFLSDRDVPRRSGGAGNTGGGGTAGGGNAAGAGSAEDGTPVSNEVFIMDSRSAQVAQVTYPVVPYTYDTASTLPVYDCPHWSPDGKVLSAITRLGQRSSLVIIAPRSGVVRSIPIDSPSRLAAPIWSPDSQTIYLAEQAIRGGPALIVSFKWQALSGAISMAALNGWEDVQALSLSPDGKQLAMVLVRRLDANNLPRAALRIYNLSSMEISAEKNLPVYELSNSGDPRRIFWAPDSQSASFGQNTASEHILWLPDGELVVAAHLLTLSPDKAMLFRYNPREDTLQVLARVKDTLTDWAIRDNWLIYGSEGGLWGMPVSQQSITQSAPLLLDPNSVRSIDWR